MKELLLPAPPVIQFGMQLGLYIDAETLALLALLAIGSFVIYRLLKRSK